MKPYETGICVCGKRREDHDETGTCDDLFQDGNGNYVPQCFLDSGTAHLCSEEVASKMLETLQKIVSICPETSHFLFINTIRATAKEAINEALKR